MEAIDHDPVEAREDLELPRRLLRKLGQPLGLAYAPEHKADQLARIGIGFNHTRFGLDRKISAGEMDGEIEG